MGFCCTTVGLSSKYTCFRSLLNLLQLVSFIAHFSSAVLKSLSPFLLLYLHEVVILLEGDKGFPVPSWFHNRGRLAWEGSSQKRQVGWERSCLPIVCRLGELQAGQVGVVRPAMPASEIRIKISLFLWSSLQTFKTYLGDLLMDLLKQFTS